MIHSSVKRWGNSPAVRIPATLMQALNLNIDDEIRIDLVEGKLVIEPVVRQVKQTHKRRFDLKTMLAQVTPDNQHEPVDFGPAQGKEVW